jgi:hypothetical protein
MRGLQFNTFWGISIEIKRGMIDIGKKFFSFCKIFENIQVFRTFAKVQL